MRYTNRRVFTQGTAVCRLEYSILTSSPSKPSYNGKPMANTHSHSCMMPRASMLKFGRPFDRTNAENFVKILQTSRPWGTNLWPKFEILTVLGVAFPHFCPDKRESWHGGADLRLSEQRVAFAGRKTHFGPVSKNNTGMAALRVDLPVISSFGDF